MYKIANLVFDIISLNLEGTESMERLVPFYTNEKKADIVYVVKYSRCIRLPKETDIIYWGHGMIVARNNHTIQYYRVSEGKAYALTEEITSSNYQIFLSKDSRDYYLHPYFMPDLLHLERALIRKKCIVLHSSYIITKKGAILFTAPSGGGKSTQAELWKKYKGTKIVNGDKSIIGKDKENWMVYGIPFSGASEYCLNETHPLYAIVILGKKPFNHLQRVGIKGFLNVFSQVTVNLWDKEFVGSVIDITKELCNEIPIYHFLCTKTEEAVDVLYRELFEKGKYNGTIE